jgi:hypothetical protein
VLPYHPHVGAFRNRTPGFSAKRLLSASGRGGVMAFRAMRSLGLDIP